MSSIYGTHGVIIANKMIENKYLYKKFDKLNEKNELPYHIHYKFNFSDYIREEIRTPEMKRFEEDYEKWRRKDKKIKKDFCNCMIDNYNASKITINFAMEIVDRSDNGFSYKDTEEWIISLLNHYEFLEKNKVV